jgi:mycobactin salicyl-AMP ligase
VTAEQARPLDGFVPWPEEFVRRYRAAGYWGAETLGELLGTWAERSGEAIAVVDGQEWISYRELDRRATAMAAGLRSRGIEAGDRVIMQLPNTAAFLEVFFGLIRCGAIPVLALPAHRRSEIEHLATHAGAVGYVIPDRHDGFDHRGLAARIAAVTPPLRHVLVAGEQGPFTALADVPISEPVELPPCHPGDVALLLMSGGTTGKPKLIPRTHRDYAYNARAAAEVCELGERDIYLACLPVAHNLTLASPGVLGTLSSGGTVVMSPAPSPDVAFGLIERERVTMSSVVPPLARLWVEAAAWDRRDLSSLRLLMVGGSRLDVKLARQIGPALGCRLLQSLGMAEGFLTYTRPGDSEEIVTTTQGRRLSPDDEMRVLDPDGKPVTPGDIGELWVRGPYTVRGYYRAPEYNRTAFSPDGFYRTGDLVRLLPSGHLIVTGRAKEVINRGGENVSAAELEEHLRAHPDIAQVAAIPLPDENLGEIVCAVISLAPGAKRAPRPRELKSYLAERGLARFKYLDRLVVIEEFPLTAVGKIDKKKLAEIV